MPFVLLVSFFSEQSLSIIIYFIYFFFFVVCGISTALMPLAVHNYTYLIILAMIFGISFSSSFSFIPILIVHLVELDDFTCAYGLVLLVQGVGSLIGPPLMGIICRLFYCYISFDSPLSTFFIC